MTRLPLSSEGRRASRQYQRREGADLARHARQGVQGQGLPHPPRYDDGPSAHARHAVADDARRVRQGPQQHRRPGLKDAGQHSPARWRSTRTSTRPCSWGGRPPSMPDPIKLLTAEEPTGTASNGLPKPTAQARRRQVQVGASASLHVGRRPTGSEALGSQPGHVQEHVGEAPSRSTVHQEGAVEPGTPPQALIGRPVLLTGRSDRPTAGPSSCRRPTRSPTMSSGSACPPPSRSRRSAGTGRSRRRRERTPTSRRRLAPRCRDRSG
jgi:hypothetical protein